MCQNPLIGDNYVVRFLCLYPLRYLFAHIVVICLDASTNVLGPMCVDTFNGLTGCVQIGLRLTIHFYTHRLTYSRFVVLSPDHTRAFLTKKSYVCPSITLRP